MEYKAEDFISFIENNRRDKVSHNGLELIAKRFRELECEVNKLSLGAVSGSLPLAAKELADEAWRMLPDSCKEIMKNLEVQYKESLAADIEHRFSGNDR
jgi:hypothetical protein